MSHKLDKRRLRFAAEALILTPVVALAVVWSSFVFLHDTHLYDSQLHSAGISWLLVVLTGVGLASFGAGLLLFTAVSVLRRR
jgi:hypothetical protein